MNLLYFAHCCVKVQIWLTQPLWISFGLPRQIRESFLLVRPSRGTYLIIDPHQWFLHHTLYWLVKFLPDISTFARKLPVRSRLHLWLASVTTPTKDRCMWQWRSCKYRVRRDFIDLSLRVTRGYREICQQKRYHSWDRREREHSLDKRKRALEHWHIGMEKEEWKSVTVWHNVWYKRWTWINKI